MLNLGGKRMNCLYMAEKYLVFLCVYLRFVYSTLSILGTPMCSCLSLGIDVICLMNRKGLSTFSGSQKKNSRL